MLPAFRYARPRTLAEALRLIAGGGRPHAGGTDLIGCLRDGVLRAELVVSLAGIPELAGIREEAGGGLVVGALTPLAEVAAHPVVRRRYAALAEAAAAVGSPQLRNQGTLGGNLCQRPRCWYYRSDLVCLRKGGDTCYAYEGENHLHAIFGGDGCYVVHPSDTAPALAALGAVARIVGPGASRAVPVGELFVPPSVDPTRETVLEPGELLVSVHLPAPPPGLRSGYRKVRSRGAWDFALAGAAVALELDARTVRHASVWLSGVAPVPWRAEGAERVLAGRPLDDAAIREAARAAVAGAEPLEHNGYKVALAEGALTAELERLAG